MFSKIVIRPISKQFKTFLLFISANNMLILTILDYSQLKQNIFIHIVMYFNKNTKLGFDSIKYLKTQNLNIKNIKLF